jgi:hypothetical protein
MIKKANFLKEKEKGEKFLKVFNLVSFQKKNERVEPIGDGLNVGFIERLQP